MDTSIASVLLIIILIMMLSTFVPLFVGLYKGAPYVPTLPKKQAIMLKFANVKKGETVADLGCGDGRFVIAMAKAGAKAYGYEINPWLVLLSRYNIWRAGLTGKAFVYHKNFLKVDTAKFDVILLYLLPKSMIRLEEKFQKELKPGTRIVSNFFTFPNWKPIQQEDNVRYYKVS